MTAAAGQPIRIANCSGFYGDRIAGAREMVEGGSIDVLTGDWLAELTMYVLSRTKARRPDGGFARTFVAQMHQVLGDCLERGIKVVSNAGGLDPHGCADAVRAVAAEVGLSVRVAVVDGDDLIDRLAVLTAAGHPLSNMDTGEPLGDVVDRVVTANAYLGCWGIAEALAKGADVVVTGRVTDAAVVMGPAAWHHGWARDDWDALAGAVVAGHIIECGAQATGGNYSFFGELPGLAEGRLPGFPWAEIHTDGTSVIGKHDGTAGGVTVGTVTSQLLYEIGGPAYGNPDVIAHFDSTEVSQEGPDRVRVSGTHGTPAPAAVKVAINYHGGWRNSMSIGLCGLDVEAKAEVVTNQLWATMPGGREAFADTQTRLIRTDTADATGNEAATAWLRVTVWDDDEKKAGRAFSGAATELALSSIPGFYSSTPPGSASAYGVYWPALLPASLVTQRVTLDDEVWEVPLPGAGGDIKAPAGPQPEPEPVDGPVPQVPEHLASLIGARSGDKGGTANVGVFARSDEAWAWLRAWLTTEQLRRLAPAETEGLVVHRYEFGNLRALNFLIVGLLGRGVAQNARQDTQAKSLGEFIRARIVYEAGLGTTP
ncbi:MAG: acyclic terpene utilization AtuA family protein [Microthrixaceae bacterium]